MSVKPPRAEGRLNRYVLAPGGQAVQAAIPKHLFQAILERIRRLWPPETVPG